VVVDAEALFLADRFSVGRKVAAGLALLVETPSL
jgi:hypothetical protein